MFLGWGSGWVAGEVAFSDSDEVEEAVEAEEGDGVSGGLADDGFGAEGDAHACDAEHGEVVGSVTYGDDLFEGDVLLGGDLAEELGFAGAIDDVGFDEAGDFAVFDVEVVGVDVVDAEALLEVASEEGESAGEDGGFVAKELEGRDELFGAFDEGDLAEELVDAVLGESAEECDSAAEALLEFDFSAHGGLGDLDDLGGYAGESGEFVDDLSLDEGGVHVEGEEAAVAAEDAFALEGDVDAEVVGEGEEGGAHGGLAGGVSAGAELDAGVGVGGGVGEGEPGREAVGEALDAVDGEAVVGDDGADFGEVVGGDGSAKDGDDEAVFALGVHPVLELGGGDGLEGHLEVEFGGFVGKGALESEEVVAVGNLNEEGEDEGLVDDGLADIEDAGVVASENGGDGGGESRAVRTGTMNQYCLVHG